MKQNQLLLPAVCIIMSSVLCFGCLILPVVLEVVKRIKLAGNNSNFYKLLLSVLAGDVLNLSVHLALDLLTVSLSGSLDDFRWIEPVTLFFMGVGYRSMVIGTIMIAWHRMQKFCITLQCKPLRWFEHPKPLIWLTWTLSIAATLVQSLVGCHMDFDPDTFGFHRLCTNSIHNTILNVLSLLGIVLIFAPYAFIVYEIIRLKKIPHQVQPAIAFSAANQHVQMVTTPRTHVGQNLQSHNAETMVSLQAILMGIILIGANVFLAFVDFGRGILALLFSQYSIIILCTYTTVLSLIFCGEIRSGVKLRMKNLFCNSDN